MDTIADYNQKRWKALSESNALFTQPHLEYTKESALAKVDSEGLFGDLAGKNVLCLGGGGGQQSGAFAILGANVTVLDLSPEQLERDKIVAEHYNVEIRTVHGDMRDLSELEKEHFDVVYQPYSLGFVPDCSVVFEQVSHILRSGGIYYFDIVNPFYLGMTQNDWNGEGYLLKHPYIDGAQIISADADWVYNSEEERAKNSFTEVREYRQTLSKILNSLIKLDFQLVHASDKKHFYPDFSAEPGTWDHFVAVAPNWLTFWARKEK